MLDVEIRMEFVSKYQSKNPDDSGFINYTAEEHRVWQQLYDRQIKLIQGRACREYQNGVAFLELSSKEIPQIPDVNEKLSELTGFSISPVQALISPKAFFELLANREFPVATFIRSQEELNYVTEPDVFHEIFGHCPMLTEPNFADFVQSYGKMVLSKDEALWPLLQRLFWFTVEFGLIRQEGGLRIYGGGILSSIGETQYSLESNEPYRVDYNPLVALRTPYRIDKMQPVYFVIESFRALYDSIENEVEGALQKALKLGEFPPFFEVEKNNPCIHIFAC